MAQLMFSVLLLVFFIGTLVYTFYFDKKSIVLLFILGIISFALINWVDWHYSAIFLLPLLTTALFHKKITYSTLASLSISGAILGSFFLLNLFINYDSQALIYVGIFSVVLISALGIMAIFENRLSRYLVYSNLIQLSFVFLDLSIAKLTLKISTLGVVQIFNYVIAGTLLFITLGILIKNKKEQKINDMRGLYYKDPATGIFASIAAISLAGVPGLNIFFSEWLLFKASFGVNPVITILGIFAALILFIMYFKIVYILLSGKPMKKEKSSLLLKFYNFILAIACLIFGILPFTQLYIFEKLL